MSLTLRGRRRPLRSDEGSTLVAAVAVAAICVGLGTLVLAQAIVVSKDSGRDRARTIEVHGAEGAVDAMYAALETTTLCSWPASGYEVVNTARDEVGVRVTIDYYDAGNKKLTCTDDTVTGGTPAQAVITSTATDTSGTTSGMRTVQAKILLTPNVVEGKGAAVFSASGVQITNQFSVGSAVGVAEEADVWVDDGNVDCNSGATVNGNLIVANGKLQTVNSCKITGNAYSSGNFGPHQGSIGGSAWTLGNAEIDPNATIGGDLLVKGTINSYGKPMKVSGTVEAGSTRVPTFTRLGLDEVNFQPADWVGFTIPTAYTSTSQGAWGALVSASAVANGAYSWATAYSPTTGDKCDIAGANWSLNGPLTGPTVNTVYDLRNCTQTKFEGGLQIKLYADTALIVKDFYATGGWTVTSGDSQPHQFWVISPDPDTTKNGTADCVSGKNGNIKVDVNASIVSPIRTFFYTPCTVDVSNVADFYGQIYGGKVNMINKLNLKYDPIGIPGVSFKSMVPQTSSGYRVDVVYKREVAR